MYRDKTLVRAHCADWQGMARSDVRMGLQELDTGAAYPEHHHTSPEIYVVLNGEAKWTVGERSIAASEGPPSTHRRTRRTGSRTRGRPAYGGSISGGAPGGDTSVLDETATRR